MRSTTVTGPLSADQLAEFEERGYLVFPSVFSREEVDVMAEEATQILQHCLNASLATGTWDRRLDVMATIEDPDVLDVRKLQPVKDLSPVFESIASDERLLGPMRQIMGSEPLLMEEKLNYKQKIRCPEVTGAFQIPQREARFNLHHDWGYYAEQGYPSEILSSAITIDETTSFNGPMRVIPGTHTREWPPVNPEAAGGSGLVDESLFPEEARIQVLAPPGSVMIFHSLLLHDSLPNTTEKPRRLMIYSHFPGSYSFEEDARNSHGRKLGREVEALYRQMVERGDYEDRVTL